MARFRRILRDFWFGAAISIILSLAIVATSVMYNTRPAFAAEAGAVADTVVKVPAIVSGPDNPRPDPGERPDTKAVGRANADSDTDIVADNCPVKLHIPKGAVGQEAEIEIIDHGSWGSTSSVVSFLELNAYPVQDNVAVTGTKIKKFNKDLTISIQNRSADLALVLGTLSCRLAESRIV
mgnify:CR=1 FL=1